MPELHALLSASGAHRWLRCPPSARLEETLPDSKSEFADEGTLAHELAALKLEMKFTIIKPSERKKRLAAIKAHKLYQAEMDGYTEVYLDYVLGVVHGHQVKPYLAIEKRVDYSSVAPEGFGTADCIVIAGTQMAVIDLKYGKGIPVSAYENEQMKLYALGAIRAYQMIYCIETVKLTIIQPRLESVSEFEISTADLLAWGDSIKPTAAMAFAGLGHYNPGEKQCQFCRAAGTCRARAEKNLLLSQVAPSLPPLLTNEEIGQILLESQDLAKWAKKLEASALKKLLDGEEIPGWKAVEGRSNREISNLDEAFAVLKNNGFDDALLYSRHPVTLSDLEDPKLVGKKRLQELIGSYIIKPSGKPTITTADDKREPYKRLSAADEFGEEKQTEE